MSMVNAATYKLSLQTLRSFLILLLGTRKDLTSFCSVGTPVNRHPRDIPRDLIPVSAKLEVFACGRLTMLHL